MLIGYGFGLMSFRGGSMSLIKSQGFGSRNYTKEFDSLTGSGNNVVMW